MDSFDNIYHKMVPSLETDTFAQLHHEAPAADAQDQIGREVAHELNNILTVIQGYADRLMLKHGENPLVRRDLQTIADNSRRAMMVIKKARGTSARQTPPTQPIAA